jgi:hypothetical protein
LFEKDGRRLRDYDRLRGSLDRYLVSLAKQEIAKYWRYRRRHRHHDAPQTSASAPEPAERGLPYELTLKEIVPSLRLTAAEEKYFWACLLALPDQAGLGLYSAAYLQKLKQRVRRKFTDYLYKK